MKSKLNRRGLFSGCSIAAAAFVTISASAYGQFSLTGASYTQDFDLLTSTGTTTTVIPGWFVGTGISSISGTTVTVGTGSSNAGGNYNFGVAGINAITDRALGSLASGSTQRNTEFRFTNNTGQNISALNILYDGEQWRVGATSVVNQMVLSFSLDGLTFTPLGTGFNFITPINGNASGAALDGNATANRVADIGGLYTLGAEITVGQTAFLRWEDIDNSSSDNAMAVDNFRLTATLVAIARTLTWAPTSGDWDTLSSNWNDGTASTTFQADDNVVFDDTGLTQSTVTIVPATVAPRSVKVTNTSGEYTFVGGAISGSTSLTKSGAGRLVLTAANTYTGATTVSGGTLTISADDQLGAANAPLVLASTAIFETTGSVTVNPDRSVSGTGKFKIAPSTTLVIVGPANLGATTLIDSGTISFSGSTAAQMTALTLEKAALVMASQPISLSGPITTTYTTGSATISAGINFGATTTTNNRFVTVADSDAASDLILSGPLSMTGSGRLVKVGDGTLELTGTNNYLGLRIGLAGTSPANGGRVIIHDADDLGTAQLQFNAGILDNPDAPITTLIGVSLGAGQFPDGGVFNGKPITFQGPSSLFIAASSTYLHKITANTDLIFAGGFNLSTNGGSGGTAGLSDGLAITGPGTVFFPAAANTLTEQIYVDAGTLEISGALTAPLPPTTTARNNGTVTGITSGAAGLGILNIASGGRLAPGTSADATGTLLVNGILNIQTDGTYFVDAEGFNIGLFDQISVTGNVTLAGNLDVNLLGGYIPSLGDKFIIIANDSDDAVLGTFNGLPEGTQVGSSVFNISYLGGDGNDVELIAVPEPGSIALLLGGLAFLGARRRRSAECGFLNA
jgi:fibronectin-binding autotransporter adhesin